MSAENGAAIAGTCTHGVTNEDTRVRWQGDKEAVEWCLCCLGPLTDGKCEACQ